MFGVVVRSNGKMHNLNLQKVHIDVKDAMGEMNSGHDIKIIFVYNVIELTWDGREKKFFIENFKNIKLVDKYKPWRK